MRRFSFRQPEALWCAPAVAALLLAATAGAARTAAAPSPATSFRAIYAVAADQQPDPKEKAGIVADIAAADGWFATQTANGVWPSWIRSVTADGKLGEPVVRTVKLPRPAAAYADADDPLGLLAADVAAVAPLGAPTEKTVIWADLHGPACGQTSPVDAVDETGASILFEAECKIYPSSDDVWPYGASYLLAHEMTHNFGAVPRCAPHYDGTAHVDDDPRDILYQGSRPRDWKHLTLDPGHDDYYATGRTDCLDIAASPFWTQVAVPPPPPGRVVWETPGGAVEVDFSAPPWNGGAPITSYTVTASPGGAKASGASSPIAVAGLVPGRRYTFSVRATSAAGTSPPSAPSFPLVAPAQSP